MCIWNLNDFHLMVMHFNPFSSYLQQQLLKLLN